MLKRHIISNIIEEHWKEKSKIGCKKSLNKGKERKIKRCKHHQIIHKIYGKDKSRYEIFV